MWPTSLSPTWSLRVNDRLVSSSAYVLLAALGGSAIAAVATVGAVLLDDPAHCQGLAPSGA